MLTFNSKLLISLLFSAFIAFAFTSPKPVHFDKMEHDFGIIPQGNPQKTIFKLTNDSDRPLVLKKVKGSCGCTATNYSMEPISAGETTEIEATYNAKSTGEFRKTVSVYTNLQDEPYILTIKGTVEAAQ